jgi:hypothetical protein
VRWREDAASTSWRRGAMARKRGVKRRGDAVRWRETRRQRRGDALTRCAEALGAVCVPARTMRVVIHRGGAVRGGASREWRASFARERRGSRGCAMSDVARRAARARSPASSSPSRRTRRPTNKDRCRAAAGGTRAFDGWRGRRRARFGPHGVTRARGRTSDHPRRVRGETRGHSRSGRYESRRYARRSKARACRSPRPRDARGRVAPKNGAAETELGRGAPRAAARGESSGKDADCATERPARAV